MWGWMRDVELKTIYKDGKYMAECWVVPIVDRAREARQKRVIGHIIIALLGENYLECYELKTN